MFVDPCSSTEVMVTATHNTNPRLGIEAFYQRIKEDTRDFGKDTANTVTKI